MSKIISKYSEEPWTVWLLICLCRQLQRQFWLNDIHEKITSADLGGGGTVPGHSEWKYDYHGMGICLTGPNNEVIDVDFHDEKALTIDPYFFTTRIFELSEPELPEGRLKYWLPEVELVILAIRNLQGEVLSPKKSHVFQLDKKYQAEWDYLSQLEFSDETELSTAFQRIENTTNEREVNKHADNFQKWLLKQLNNKNLNPSGFEALARYLPEAIQTEVCLKQLRKVDHKMASAVNVLASNNNAPVKEVTGVLNKLNKKKHHPYLAHTVCSYLLSRNTEKEACIATLIAFSDRRVVDGYGGNPYDYNLAHLMLRYSPDNGIILLRRALRSSTPGSVQDSAALMAAIDENWRNKELIQVLIEKPFEANPTSKRYIVAALLNSRDPAIREIGRANNPPLRVRMENEEGYTYDEVVEHNLSESFKYYLKEIKGDLDLLDIEKIRRVVS